MQKIRNEYRCVHCQKSFSKWQGKCDHCNSWDSLEKIATNNQQYPKQEIKIDSLADISEDVNQSILKIGVHELDRVLGKGIVYQSIGLLAGAPGIGKSTLILQILGRLTKVGKKVLYISGEESKLQIKTRAERLAIPQEKILILIENSLENILGAIYNLKPDFVVIDSIQTIASEQTSTSAGSINQVRECTIRILEYSKKHGSTFLLVGHITKDGNLAGPKVLEHMVDYVLYLEEENNQGMKVLRAIKNRFGSIYESGFFRMTPTGLAEVSQPNQSLLVDKNLAAGSSFFPMLQGNRILLIEVQALVSKNSHPASLKTTVGIDRGKILLILAVLDKYLNINLLQNDVYINVAGGYRCNEPAVDLSIIGSILSSYYHKPLPKASIFFGEIALTGKINSNHSWKERIKEIQRCGFQNVFLGKIPVLKNNTLFQNLQIKSSENLQQFLDFLDIRQ